MKNLKVIPITEKGKRALKHYYAERAGKPIMRLLGIHVSMDGDTLNMTFGGGIGPLMQPAHVTMTVIDSMMENDCVQGIDYRIEVE